MALQPRVYKKHEVVRLAPGVAMVAHERELKQIPIACVHLEWVESNCDLKRILARHELCCYRLCTRWALQALAAVAGVSLQVVMDAARAAAQTSIAGQAS